jgi:transcriptional repressor NrdR
MICINCLHGKTEIINSRSRNSGLSVWRRHRCPTCEYVYTTEETIPLDSAYKVTSSLDGSSTPFSITKLILGLAEPLQAASGNAADAYWLAQTVQQRIVTAIRPAQKLTSDDVAQHCWATLHKYNQLAGSIYARRHGIQEPKRGRPAKG